MKKERDIAPVIVTNFVLFSRDSQTSETVLIVLVCGMGNLGIMGLILRFFFTKRQQEKVTSDAMLGR